MPSEAFRVRSFRVVLTYAKINVSIIHLIRLSSISYHIVYGTLGPIMFNFYLLTILRTPYWFFSFLQFPCLFQSTSLCSWCLFAPKFSFYSQYKKETGWLVWVLYKVLVELRCFRGFIPKQLELFLVTCNNYF